MTLNQLKYFVEVVNRGSFAAASKVMYVSQPAIAQAIRELEDEFSLRLFDRNNNRLTLTEDGKWLLVKAEALLQTAESLERDMHLRSSNKNYVKVGVAPMFGNLYFYEKLNGFRSDKPELHVDVEEAGSLEIRKWIEMNAVDIGVCVLSGISGPRIATQKLMDVELKFCVHKSHPLAQKKVLDFSDLAGTKICLLKQDSYQNVFVQQKLDEAGVPFEVMMYSSQLSSISTMLCYSDCGAFLFGDSSKLNPSIVSISMREPIYLPIGFAWNANQPLYPQVEEFKNYFVHNFKSKD